VWSDPEELRDPLDGAGSVQHDGAVHGIGHPLVEVVQREPHAFHRD
jgi:hypothetical protein